jgi:hypothetical protein
VFGLGCGGCIEIDGGAVEARWVLRTNSGIALTCDDDRARIDAIRFILDLQNEEANGADPCGDDPRCEFRCERGVGTTPFFIPDGMYAISLQVLDANATALGPRDGVIVPSALVRQVRTGQLTNLNVNLIIVER